MAENRDIDKRVNEKFLLIDKKIKDAFIGVKKDIQDIKSGISNNSYESFKENFEQIRKEIDNLKIRGDSIKVRDNERITLEKKILELKIKDAKEAQKKKSQGNITRLINRIGVWKEKHKLNKQYRKQLEQINKKHAEFEQELIEKTKQLNKLYSKSLAKLEQERQKDKEMFIVQNEQAESQRNQVIKELSNTINKSEKKFGRLIRDIEEKRREDSAIVNNQINSISENINYERKRTEKSINELKIEIDNLKSKKIRDEKKIQYLENEKNYLQDKLKEVKSIKGYGKSFKLPKFSLPKFNFPKIGIKSSDVKEGFWLAVPYIFLVILTIVALNQYFKWDVVSLNTIYWMVAGVIFGGLTFWKNRDKIESSMEDEKKSEELSEKKRANEFSNKFPRLTKFDFDYGVLSNWKESNYVMSILRVIVSPFVFIGRLPYSFVKWMYKEGFWYSTAVILLMIIGFAIRIYHLGDLSLWWDEITTGTYVTRIMETGLPINPSGQEYYWRGVAYHYVVSIFIYLFGNTEFWLRFPSVIFGMGIVIIVFTFGKRINKSLALGVLLFLVFSTYNIEYSRFARFYGMNTFLFMIGILFFYEGFFNNKLIYKFLSAIIALIMVYTVQFGAIFLSLLAAWIICIGLLMVKNRDYKNLIKRNVVNFVFILIIASIFIMDNLLSKFIKIKSIYPAAAEVMQVAPPTSWNYLQLPNFSLLKFYNDFSIPILFLFLGLISTVYLSFQYFKSTKKINFTGFLLMVFLVSVLLYEIGSRGVYGARIFFFAEGFIALFSIYSVWLLLKILTKNRKLVLNALILIVILLTVVISPNFYDRLNINYGQDISNDPFRTTEVAKYRADYKTTYLYLKENKKPEDIWITVMGGDYFYLNETPDYIVNQNLRWNTFAAYDNKSNFILDGSILVESTDYLKHIIKKNSDKRVWLIVNGGSTNILYTTHVRQDFLNFLDQNRDHIVFSSSDGYSKIFAFN